MTRKAENKIKMFLAVKILLAVTVMSFVACDDEAIMKKIEESQKPLKENLKENFQKQNNDDHTKIEKSWKDRLLRPLFYGRKFELEKQFSDANQEILQKGKLISPLITSPIRTLPLRSQMKTNWNILQQNQNDILNSVRDSLYESNFENFNKSYLAKEVSELENIGGEESSDIGHNIEDDLTESLSSKSSKDSDKSLAIVLPFKAQKDGNIEELLPQNPLVYVLNASEDLSKNIKETTEPQKISTKFIKKRWRPNKIYRTTETKIPESTTNEYVEEATKTYTNYNNVEQVTRKFELYRKYSEENQNYEDDMISQYKPSKHLRNKTIIQKETEIETEKNFVTPTTTLSPMENMDFNKEEFEKPTSIFKTKRTEQKLKPTSTEGLLKPADLNKVLDVLPLDMREVFEQMELNKENKELKTTHKNVYNFKRLPQPTIDPQSYSKFRPLPLDRKDSNRSFVSDEMKNLLESFGLLPIVNRAQKSLSEKTSKKEPKSVEEISAENLDFLTDDLKSVLEDMGLVKNNDKKEPTRIHIFNPSNHTMAHTDEDRIKLKAILSSIKTTVNNTKPLTPESQMKIIQKIKELDNLKYKSKNLTEINNEIQKIVDENKFVSTNKQKTTKRATKLFDGPDPIYFVEESLLKNDVKRQDVSNTTFSLSSSVSNSSSSSSDTSSLNNTESESSTVAQEDNQEAVSTTTSTTEENSNLEALRQSFGGGETAPDDADIESELPPKRPNGLYFLFDWNSFFEVGSEEDGERRVQLRFQPKVGDPRNFLTVTIP